MTKSREPQVEAGKISKLIRPFQQCSLSGMGNVPVTKSADTRPHGTRILGKVEQAETALRKAIQSGRWSDKLPGMRALAGFLGVSGGTLGKALKTLEAAGIIAGSGPKSRYRILLRPGGPAASEPGEMTLMVLIPKAVGKNASGAHWHLVARLSELLATKGWRVRSHTTNMAGNTVRTKAWDRLVAMEDPDAVIAILGNGALARWATRRNLRILFCGGSAEGTDVPVIGVSTGNMLEHALGILLDAGHERISFPLCGRVPSFSRNLSQRFRSVLARRGLRFSERFNTPAAGERSPKDLRRLFQRTDAAFHPTAWICLDWVEFLCVKRLLKSQGRNIPGDVSIICLSSDEAIDWVEPSPSHFEHPLEALARGMAKWVREPRHGEKGALQLDIPPAWIPGSTVGPPPVG